MGLTQPQQPNPPPGTSAGGLALKPARVLGAWLPEQMGLQLLAASGPVDLAASVGRLQALRQTVASRPAYSDATLLGNDMPPELDSHLAAFWANPAYQTFVAEGWTARMIDLRTVVAGQDRVWLDRSRVPQPPKTLAELAEVTLPATTSDQQISAQAHGNGVLVTSVSPNLRPLGPFMGPIGPGGPTVVGFMIGVPHSVVQVVELDGRPVLRDGYHRAVELLRYGIHEVPALMRTMASSEEVLPPVPGILPTAAWRGERPPTLSDFLDDAVSLDMRLPRRDEKAIVIQLAEFA